MLRHISYLAAVALVPAALLYWVFGCSSSAELPGGSAAPAATPPSAPLKWEVPTYPFPPRPATAPSAVRGGDGLTEQIHQAALDWFDRALEQVDKMVPAAEDAARRLLDGGKLFIAGSEGFVEEVHYRAGGLAFTQKWDRQRAGPNDVFILGHVKSNDSGASWVFFDSFHRYLRLRNGLVMHFASLNWPDTCRQVGMKDEGFWGDRVHRFDTGAPGGEGLAERALQQMATVALAWAFQAEMMAAATRQGKTFATYCSDDEPAAKGNWDQTVQGKTVHPQYTVAPIPAGKLGRQYLRACRAQAAEFLRTQSPAVRRAAGKLAECMRAGGMAWLTFSGHVMRNDCVLPRELPVNFVGRDYMLINAGPNRLPKGDVLLWFGYISFPKDVVRAALDCGCDCVVVSLEPPSAPDARVLHINGCWQAYDSVIDLPDYPIRVLPTSGVVQTLQWFSLLGETAKLYRR